MWSDDVHSASDHRSYREWTKIHTKLLKTESVPIIIEGKNTIGSCEKAIQALCHTIESIYARDIEFFLKCSYKYNLKSSRQHFWHWDSTIWKGYYDRIRHCRSTECDDFTMGDEDFPFAFTRERLFCQRYYEFPISQMQKQTDY